jgi:hypothetical protein
VAAESAAAIDFEGDFDDEDIVTYDGEEGEDGTRSLKSFVFTKKRRDTAWFLTPTKGQPPGGSLGQAPATRVQAHEGGQVLCNDRRLCAGFG